MIERLRRRLAREQGDESRGDDAEPDPCPLQRLPLRWTPDATTRLVDRGAAGAPADNSIRIY